MQSEIKLKSDVADIGRLYVDFHGIIKEIKETVTFHSVGTPFYSVDLLKISCNNIQINTHTFPDTIPKTHHICLHYPMDDPSAVYYPQKELYDIIVRYI